MGTKPQHFPCAPVAAILRGWIEQQDWDPFGSSAGNFRVQGYPCSPIKRMAHESGVSEDILWKVKADKKYIDFDHADRIICAINPFLWHSDPELSAAYQEFDLARLDRYRPTERMAA